MTALGSDHAGYALKQEIIHYFKNNNINFTDFGCYSPESDDYPIYARKVCEAVLSGQYEKGILVCGMGNGMTIAANRYNGIRAALCNSIPAAIAARDHNDANILVMGEQAVGLELGLDILKTFLETKFSYAEKHVRRLSMIDGLA